MAKLVHLTRKASSILVRRLRTQGVKTTLIWAYGRGWPKLTGVPVLRFSQITPTIYVGPQYQAKGKALLEKVGITGDVNMRVEFDDAEHNLALTEYCHLPTIDDDAPSLAHLDEGVAFIKRVVAKGGKVYIHCAGGIGRAPTMAAAYFISQGMQVDEALALIRRVRPFINITPPQLEQLHRFEKRKRET
jgi:hypothetical protein